MATGTITASAASSSMVCTFRRRAPTIHKERAGFVAQSALKVGEIARIKGSKNDTGRHR